MNRTSIEWTDFTTNPIRYRDPEGRSVHGCIKVSAGCANCYASAWSARGLTGETGGAFTAKRWPWRLTPPHASREQWWGVIDIVGRDGKRIEAWFGPTFPSLASVLGYIQRDIEAHRQLPYDEDRERARLMPV